LVILNLCGFRGGKSACAYDDCPDSPLRPIAELYMINPDFFIESFVTAYTVMTLTVPAGVELKEPLK